MGAMRWLALGVAGALSCGCSYHKYQVVEEAVTDEAYYTEADLDTSPHEELDRIEWTPGPGVPGLPQVVSAARQPLSTFSVDVDTASYARSREALREGRLPAPWSVRAEEFINYFDHGYPLPMDPVAPFSVTLEAAPAPWAPKRHLLLVGLKGYEVPAAQLPPANLVFLVDTSGSMDLPNRLPLLKQALDKLVDALRPQDRVAIVTYAGHAGLLLPSTTGDRKAVIRHALQRLTAEGSTDGGEGIKLAYAIARNGMIEGGINRVILASDGDFNVGVVSLDELETLVAEQRESGVSLTVLGFGTPADGELRSEKLADAGNGNYAYIDDAAEADRVLRRELSSSLLTIASDVKVQVEFNPAQVADYRLIGYANRVLASQQFADDRVDAGEIGAGHDVTALYDLALVGSGGSRMPHEPAANAGSLGADEIARVRLRYKLPGETESRLIEQPLVRADLVPSPSARLRFAAAVAGYADRLCEVSDLDGYDFVQLAALAASAGGADPDGARAEFVDLVELAGAMQAAR